MEHNINSRFVFLKRYSERLEIIEIGQSVLLFFRFGHEIIKSIN